MPEDSGDKSIHAAEIALGLTAPTAADAGLDAEVAQWEERLAHFAQELPPEEPPPAIWSAICSATRPAMPPWWRGALDSLAVWRSLSALGFAAAVVALVLLPRSAPITPSPPGRTLLVSSLRQKEGTPLYVVTYDPARMLIVAVPAGAQPARGVIPKLWLVPRDVETPVALGLIDPLATTAFRLTIGLQKVPDCDSGLVVTLEPEGLPLDTEARGAVVAHGRLGAF